MKATTVLLCMVLAALGCMFVVQASGETGYGALANAASSNKYSNGDPSHACSNLGTRHIGGCVRAISLNSRSTDRGT